MQNLAMKFKCLAQFPWHIYNNHLVFIADLTSLFGSSVCLFPSWRGPSASWNIWEQLYPHHEEAVDLNRMVKLQYCWISLLDTYTECCITDVQKKKRACVCTYLRVSVSCVHTFDFRWVVFVALSAWTRLLFIVYMHEYVSVAVCMHVLEGGVYVQEESL